MTRQDWTLLTKVPDLVMRGALVARLAEGQIEVYTPDRDVIVNVGAAPNLSLEGYSALFDGYSIYVYSYQLSEARKILLEFESEIWGDPKGSKEKSQVDYMEKFYFAAIMTWALPLVFHILAVYHFYKAKKAGQKGRFAKLTFSWVIWLITIFAAIGLVSPYLTWWHFG